MSILLIGSEGSMGKRYQAILRFLEVDYSCLDKSKCYYDLKTTTWVEHHKLWTWADYYNERNINWKTEKKELDIKKVKGIIVATPTDTHIEVIKSVLPCQKPILCEKPIVKNDEHLLELKNEIQNHNGNLSMMFQYEHLDNPKFQGLSHYNFFRHGNDGLDWDCMQIIALARGEVSLREDSPIWNCVLNGKKLSLDDMDHAYVKSVSDWLDKPENQFEKIIHIYEKVDQWLKLKKSA